MVQAGNGKELYVLRSRGGIQHAIQCRPNQQILKSVKRTDCRHEQDGSQDVSPVRERIAQEPRQLPHGTPRRGWPQSLAARGIGMECKPLFYLSCHYPIWPFQLPGPLRTKFELLLRTIAMDHLHPISRLPQVSADVSGNNDRTMLSPSATETNGQVALAFMDVVRQQVNQQIGDALDEFLGLGERADILRHARVASCQRAKLWHKVRVGQEPHVKDEVGILGHAMTKAETHARDQDAFLARLLAETLRNVGPQFMDVELRGVDDEIGQPADRAQMAPLGLQCRFYWRVRAQRVGTAGFAEPSQKHSIGCLQVDDLGGNHFPY